MSAQRRSGWRSMLRPSTPTRRSASRACPRRGPTASYGHGPNGERSPRFTRIGFAKRNRAAQRTKPKRHASGMLTVELPAAKAAHVAAAKAAHVAAAEAARVDAAEAAHLDAAEVVAAEAACVAEISAYEPWLAPAESEAVVEAVVEVAPSDEAGTPPVRVAPTVVVAGVIVRPVVIVVAAVGIAGRGNAADHAWIIAIAVCIAVPVPVCIAVRVAVMVGVDVAVMWA